MTHETAADNRLGLTRLRPELLAPAGSKEALRAAVENGADGVYFGLDDFNARLRAPNFTVSDLPELVAWLHERGVRAYVTLNTLVFPDELETMAHLLMACSQAGVDGVMVQDLGVAYLARHLVPDLPIHASTQTTLSAPESLQACERLGLRFSRLVAPRELTHKEIAVLALESQADIEVFIHGALCVAYSGQCLTSEALGGRSANRGECAQACRLPYDLIVDGKPHPLGEVKYLLSPRDLASYADLPQLIAAGVKSLKIEGRLKSADYVAATLQTYRAALERALSASPSEKIALDRAELYRLEMTFSRGFTAGYLHEINHQAVVEGRFPKKRGPYLGRVLRVGKRGVVCELVAPLTLGDGVVFDCGRPDLEEVGGRVYALFVGSEKRPRVEASAERPVTVRLELARSKFDPQRVHAGNRLWKTSDPRLESALRQTYETSQPRWRRPISAVIELRPGEPARLTLCDHWGLRVTVADDHPLEAPQQHPTTESQIREQLARLGGTPFELGDLVIDAPLPVYVPVSRLNALRRQAVAALIEKRRQRGRDRCLQPDALAALRRRIQEAALPPQPQGPHLNVLCRTLEQVRVAAAHPCVSTIYTDFENLRWHAEAVSMIREAGKRFAPATLRVFKPGEHNFLRALLRPRPDAVLVRNLAAWYLLGSWEPELPLIGDYALNVANEITAWVLIENGFSYLTPSYDLNGEQLLTLMRSSSPAWFEVTVHQHMPMFHMEHCVFCRFLSEGTDYTNCGRPCDHHRLALRDRMRYDHPVKADAGCRNTVYNAVAQSAAEYVPALLEVGVRRFRVEFIEEEDASTRRALDAYAELLAGRRRAGDVWRELKAHCRVGVTRGTLDHH